MLLRALRTVGHHAGRKTAISSFHAVGNATRMFCSPSDGPQAKTSIAGGDGSRIQVEVTEGSPSMGVGRSVWESGLRLVDFLDFNYREEMAGAKVLELGTGTGVVGISAACMGAHAVLTDREPRLFELIESNVKKNAHTMKKGGGTAVSTILEWGNKHHIAAVQKLGPFDFIIGSDILYTSSVHAKLAETIKTLIVNTPDHSTKVFIAYPSRDLCYRVRIDGVDPEASAESARHRFSAVTLKEETLQAEDGSYSVNQEDTSIDNSVNSTASDAASSEDQGPNLYSSIVGFYPPTGKRVGNSGYSVYIMSLEIKATATNNL